jgi:hypothetical protein
MQNMKLETTISKNLDVTFSISRIFVFRVSVCFDIMYYVYDHS